MRFRWSVGWVWMCLLAGLPAVASAYEVVPVVDGGTISGVVTLKGIPLAPKVFKVEKTPEVCGVEDRLLREVRRGPDGGLADVVLFLEAVERGKPFSEVTLEGPPPGGRQVTQTAANEYPGTLIKPKSCVFGAFTGVIADGKLFRFQNLDPVKHSPHGYAVKGKVRNSIFNQDLEGDGTLEIETKFKKKTQKSVKIECDQHNHMQNWFYRVDNPYFAFSADDGAFVIEGVPAGTYRLIAWHPKFKIKKQSVTVGANGQVQADFEFVSKVKKVAGGD